MTNKEKFEAIGKFIKDYGDTLDDGTYKMFELMEEMELEYADHFDPAYWIRDDKEPFIQVGASGWWSWKRYEQDQVEELIKDLKKRLKCVKELCDLLEEIDK